MKKLIAALAVTTAILTPQLAIARTVTIDGTMASWRGNRAYFAIYVTDAAGAYRTTLYVAGSKSRYFRDMRSWYREVSNAGGIDGITGASVGSDGSFSIDVELADALIDAGYEVRVDSVVEHGNLYTATPTVPLSQDSSGQSFTGSGYIASLRVTM